MRIRVVGLSGMLLVLASGNLRAEDENATVEAVPQAAEPPGDVVVTANEPETVTEPAATEPQHEPAHGHACKADGPQCSCKGGHGHEKPCEGGHGDEKSCEGRHGHEKPCKGGHGSADGGCPCKKRHAEGLHGGCPHAGGHAAGHPHSRFRPKIDGKLRAEFATFTAGRFFGLAMSDDDAADRNPYVGRSDGFALGDAVVQIRGRHDDLAFVIGFNGAAATYADDQDTEGQLSVALRDAYFGYHFAWFADLSVGRFKPPFDMESLTPTENQYFVQRALESRGVERHEGYSGDMPGFAPGRQLGLMLGGALLREDVMNVGYQLALTNGNSGFRNDNDLPAVTLRFAGHWALESGDDKGKGGDEGPATYGIRPGVQAGLAASWNRLTVGEPPNRQQDEVWSAGVDVAAKASVFVFQGQALYSTTAHRTRQDAARENGIGFHAQLSVEIPDTGLAPGYRFALYNPRIFTEDDTSVGADLDQVMHHTVGLRYATGGLPLAVLLDFTRAVEQAGRALPNDRVELAAQINFE